MKKIVLKTTAILLILAGMIVACGKEKEDSEDIQLKYQKCECDHVTEFIKTFTANNILLFDTEKITYEEKIMELAKNEEQPFKHVVCNFTEGIAMFMNSPSLGGHLNWYANICNFPFDFPWDIDEKGIRISIVADDYVKCQPVSTTGNIHSDFILTSLKIHTK